jgi:DNA-binding NarL/FixJ family response regulator
VADAIKVLLVDDHQVVRRGLRTFLEVQDDIEVVGEASDGAEGVARAQELGPDVVLMDVKMPGMDGVEALRELRALDNPARVLIVTSFTEQRTVVPALRAGAAGYVTKTEAPTELLAAVAKVHAGGRYVSPTLAERLADTLAAGAPGRPHEALSAREYQVLCLLGAGKTNKQIAAAFRVGPKTISTYRSRILRKLNLKTNADLVRYVIEHGLTT